MHDYVKSRLPPPAGPKGETGSEAEDEDEVIRLPHMYVGGFRARDDVGPRLHLVDSSCGYAGVSVGGRLHVFVSTLDVCLIRCIDSSPFFRALGGRKTVLPQCGFPHTDMYPCG